MGKQVYISDRHHKKLKMASGHSGEAMGEIVERKIEGLQVPGWDGMEEQSGSQPEDN